MKALKMNIYTKITSGWLVHALVYDLKAKRNGVIYELFLQPLDIVTQRLNFAKKNWIFFILNSYKSFKMEYI